jgi:hypothetical protein
MTRQKLLSNRLLLGAILFGLTSRALWVSRMDAVSNVTRE